MKINSAALLIVKACQKKIFLWRSFPLQRGETLRAYDADEFYYGNWFNYLCLDQAGVLWALYWDYEELAAVFAPCKPGVEESDTFFVDCSDLTNEADILGIAAWTDFFVIRLSDNRKMLLVDTSSGTAVAVKTWEGILSCCLDENGDLYYLTNEDTFHVIKYSLSQNKVLWDSFDSTHLFAPSSLSCTPGGGLFLLFPYEEKLLWIDPGTGEMQELVDLAADVNGLPSDLLPSSFSVDSQYRIYFNYFDFNFQNPDAPVCRRELYLLEPQIAEIQPADIVTLTITAPYKVESIAGAVRMYQREHPEVDVVWDTQYISREEFQANSLEYKDQIALRLITGDVGDLVMVTGSGLGTETMTQTDAFADLSGYLSTCPFQDELPNNFLKPLQGTDGAVRGLPVAVFPSYYVWNQDLLEELEIAPDTVTWSQLLDLALEWQENNIDLSLTVSEAGPYMESLEEGLLRDMLLANLYDAQQADGSVQLDQPYFRELLTKFKTLHASRQLIRSDGDAGKSLFMGCIQEGGTTDRAAAVNNAAKNSGVCLRVAPCPLGEASAKRQGYAFCWGISQASENKDAAWGLLQFIVSGDGLPQYTYTSDTLPINTTAQENWFAYNAGIRWNGMGTTEQIEEYFRQIQSAIDVEYVRFDEPTGWSSAVYEPVEQYISGHLTLDEAMETANANWERFVLE